VERVRKFGTSARSELGIGHGVQCKNQPACLCVCLSAAACPHYCTDPDITSGSDRGCPLVVHYWADLHLVHGLPCYGNIMRTRSMPSYIYSESEHIQFVTLTANGNQFFGRLFVKRFALCYRTVVLSYLPVLSVTLVYCGQTVGWMDRSCPHCVRWGPSSLSPKGHSPPIFGPYLLRPNGCMDQDATAHGARPRPWRPC